MRKFYNTLSEKYKRRYAATEAIKFGNGGVSIIAEILGCARSTIHIGIAELKSLPTDCGYDPAIRITGGGRKPYDQTRHRFGFFSRRQKPDCGRSDGWESPMDKSHSRRDCPTTQ